MHQQVGGVDHRVAEGLVVVLGGVGAPEAAGRIHTDMERGFVRAEVVSAGDLVANGSVAAARERGLVRLEGRAYEVRDGDVITFRFTTP